MIREVAPRGVVGVFVGGAARRMNGVAKGRLIAPGGNEAIVVRTVRAARSVGFAAVFVGDASRYRDLVPDIEVVEDTPRGIGPLGGLAALLAFAHSSVAIAVACDMPMVDAEALSALAHEDPEHAIVAARSERAFAFEPLLARYDSARVLAHVRVAIDAGERSFQSLFRRLTPHPTESPAVLRALVDWDVPDDVVRTKLGPTTSSR